MQKVLTLHEKDLEHAAYASVIGGLLTVPTIFLPIVGYIIFAATMVSGVFGLRSKKKQFAIVGLGIVPISFLAITLHLLFE